MLAVGRGEGSGGPWKGGSKGREGGEGEGSGGHVCKGGKGA